MQVKVRKNVSIFISMLIHCYFICCFQLLSFLLENIFSIYILHAPFSNNTPCSKSRTNERHNLMPIFPISSPSTLSQNIYMMFFHQYFFANNIMADFGLQNAFIPGFLDFQSPLIRLYCVKKSIEQELIKQIQINSYLQKIFEERQSKKCKIQHILYHSSRQISTSIKLAPLPKKDKKKHYIKKLKNDTKNIPKNFGKAIITFVEQREDVIRRLIANQDVSYDNFYSALKDKKRGINSIADLRNLWLDQNFQFARQMRMVSLYFLKRGSLNYVFSSRIANHQGHVKYRNRLIEVLRCPQDFTSIKTN